MSWGVCCIVFDIDGMLFEFFMNFLNIEKNKNFRICFEYFIFSLRFILFPTFKKKCGVKEFPGGGGGVGFQIKNISFTFYAIFNIKKKIETLKSAPSLTG